MFFLYGLIIKNLLIEYLVGFPPKDRSMYDHTYYRVHLAVSFLYWMNKLLVLRELDSSFSCLLIRFETVLSYAHFRKYSEGRIII